MSHFISLKYFSAKEINELIDLSFQMKQNPLDSRDSLKGKSVGLLFEKPSLRTKTAFYIGAVQLGADVIYYTPNEIKVGERERVCDVARTLSLYLDIMVMRTFSHDSILRFTEFSAIPIVNGLSDFLHPSQALADLLTIKELKGSLRKPKVVYIGDGNNVCHSLIYAFSILGGNLTVITPSKYAPAKAVLGEVKNYCKISGAKIKLATSLQPSVQNADVLYTDVWTSMGKEKESRIRKKAFKSFQINDKILKLARKDCMVMHCLPAHRGEEITDSVIDSKNSVVFTQAENRLHTAKAILTYIVNK